MKISWTLDDPRPLRATIGERMTYADPVRLFALRLWIQQYRFRLRLARLERAVGMATFAAVSLDAAARDAAGRMMGTSAELEPDALESRLELEQGLEPEGGP